MASTRRRNRGLSTGMDAGVVGALSLETEALGVLGTTWCGAVSTSFCDVLFEGRKIRVLGSECSNDV